MICCKDCGEYSYTRQWKSETFCAPHTFFQQVSYITTDGIICGYIVIIKVQGVHWVTL